MKSPCEAGSKSSCRNFSYFCNASTAASLLALNSAGVFVIQAVRWAALPSAEPAYMRCVYQNWIDYAAGAIPGADTVYDNFFELTGRQPKTWTKFAEEHADVFKY